MRTFLLLLLTCITQASFGNIQSYTLDNGLRVLVKEDHRAPVAVSMVWYDVGSADEPGGLTGISHALEHLMFKGTPTYPLGVFSKTISSLGGQENAFTSTDYTAYFEKIASAHISTSLALEADRMQHLLLDPEEFKKEMKVVQEERRLRTDDNPQALTLERFLAAAHLASPYHHPVIGWMDDIQHLDVSDIRRWYQRFYAPNNATLVVVGDVNPDEIHTLAKQHFGSIKPQPLIERKQQTEPERLGEKHITVKAPANIPLLIQGFTVPSVKTADKDHVRDPYALEIIAALLDAGESGRFSQNLIRKSERASSIGVSYKLYSRYQSQFMVYGAPGVGHTLETLAEGIASELNRLKTEPVTDAELKRIKTQLIAQKTFERDSVFGQAMELGILATLGLDTGLIEQYNARIRDITAEDILAAANSYFDDSNMTQANLIPQARAPKGESQ